MCCKEYEKLSDEQLKAVVCEEENILVSAGPGSGKTVVIVNKVHHLIKYKNVNPRNIIVITFTKSAANNMRNRYKYLSKEKVSPFFGTFHGLFYKILNSYYGKIDIIESQETYKIIRSFLSTYIDEVGDEKVKEYINNISLFKSSNLQINEFETTLDKDLFKNCYEIYESYKNEKNIYDFDDLQIMCKNLFIKNPRLLQNYKDLFKYILIDEFQDCDEIQIDILKLLKGNNQIFAVGDEDQCIYSFRGSRPDYMVDFNKYFPNSKEIFLSTNYRCTNNIVETSMKVIKKNFLRSKKNIIAHKKYNGEIKIISSDNENLEADYIASHIEKKIITNKEGLSDFAVIYRTNIESRNIIDTFIRKGIPFRLLDKEYNFFEHFICQDIISYLRLSINNKDKESFLRIINKPYRYVSKVLLEKIRYSTSDEDCFEILKSSNDIKAFQIKNIDKLKSDIHSLNKMSLNTAIAFIIQDLGYYDYLKDYSSRFKGSFKDLENILEEFKSSAYEHRAIISFLAYIEEYKNHIVNKNKKEDAVILSTIHGVKGMEFKNVFIINMVQGYIPHENNIENNIEEERRLFYVAMTRSIENLFLFIPKKIQSQSYRPSQFIKECEYKNSLPFKLDDLVVHKSHGRGKITYVDEVTIEIEFNNITKRFDLNIVCDYNLIELVDK